MHLCCNCNNGNDMNTCLSTAVSSHTGLNCTTGKGAVHEIKPVSSGRVLQTSQILRL